MTEAVCFAHTRRKFYELAAGDGGRVRIDALFDIERGINGETAERRV